MRVRSLVGTSALVLLFSFACSTTDGNSSSPEGAAGEGETDGLGGRGENTEGTSDDTSGKNTGGTTSSGRKNTGGMASSGGKDTGGMASSGGKDTGGMASSGGAMNQGGLGGSGGISEALGEVKVHVDVAGSPASDAAVMVSDPSGKFVKTVRTDASGNVSIVDFPVGGFVSSWTDNTAGNQRDFYTLADVQDGQHVVFGDFQRRQGDALPHIKGTLAASDPAGETYYLDYRNGGGTIGATYQFNFGPASLDGSGALNFVLRARNNTGLTVASAAFPAVDLSAASPDVTLNVESDDWTSNLATHVINLENDGPTLSRVYVDIAGMRNGISYHSASAYLQDLTGSATHSWTEAYHPTFHDRVRMSARHLPPSDTYSYSVAHDTIAGVAAAGTTETVSRTTSDLPGSLEGIDIDMDAMTADLSAVGNLDCGDDAPQTLVIKYYGDTGNWYFQLRFSESATLPELDPAEMLNWSGTVGEVNAMVISIEGGSYDDFRDTTMALTESGDAEPFLGSLPAGSRVCRSTAAQGGG